LATARGSYSSQGLVKEEVTAVGSRMYGGSWRASPVHICYVWQLKVSATQQKRLAAASRLQVVPEIL